MTAAASTAIRAAAYDRAARQLDIEFAGGRRYQYHAVPADVADAFADASSKGQFFNRAIRDRFRFTRRHA